MVQCSYNFNHTSKPDYKHNTFMKIVGNTKDTLEGLDMKLKPQTINVKGHFKWKLHKVLTAKK